MYIKATSTQSAACWRRLEVEMPERRAGIFALYSIKLHAETHADVQIYIVNESLREEDGQTTFLINLFIFCATVFVF